MKQKGFTMIELLVVIVILGLLAVIIYPVINRQINRSKENLYKAQIEIIEKGARNWGADNFSKLPIANGSQVTVTLGDLETEGYIENNLINPKTKEQFSKDIIITVKMEGNSLNYTVGV